MKKVIIALLFLSSFTAVSQESVLLRVNYTKGDKYVVKVEQKQNMGIQGGSNLTMTMNMLIGEVNGKTFKTESKITSILMYMMQGGQTMSFDSSKKAEDLDQMGQLLKSQFDPMMKVSIVVTINELGENIDVKVVPAIPGTEALAEQSSSISYPKEKVSVGSTWTSDDDNQGLKTNMTYKVAKIENGSVYLDITGKISGISEGTAKGYSKIDIKTGSQVSSEIEMTITSAGTTMKSSSKTTLDKVK